MAPKFASLLPALFLSIPWCAVEAAPRPAAAPPIEARSLDDIYQAALAEGGVVNMWAGGDEVFQQNFLKEAFEAKFPGMTLNVTVDLSKYHDARLDDELAKGNVPIDLIMLQTVQDFPRWAEEGRLLPYAPAGFDQITPAFKDASAAYYGLSIISWTNFWSTQKLPGVAIQEWEDFLQPALKDKIVLAYPNDDDAVLWAFDLLLQAYGDEFIDRLLAQNPRFVRGTQTPATLIRDPSSTYAATFTSGAGWPPANGTNVSKPTQGAQFVSWAQTGAILKGAANPEGAKLLVNFLLSPERQSSGWSVREDVPLPQGFPFGELLENTSTATEEFPVFMNDRARVGRLRDYFEMKIGTAQGDSPLVDDL